MPPENHGQRSRTMVPYVESTASARDELAANGSHDCAKELEFCCFP